MLFGLNVDPNTDALQETYQRAEMADTLGYDLITIQDHPYQRRFLDTWTLLSVLAARTKRVHLGTNVANIPLRPPAMLAKSAASLDVISGGRVELGIGAGGFWRAIEAWGVPARSPKEAYEAFEDALHIIKGMWQHAGGSFSYQGRFYSVKGAQPGPAPAHPIPIWTGAIGPKMLKLTGRMADGVLLSSSYVPADQLTEKNALIDEGAAQAGRSPDSIRRGYNLMGIVEVGQFGRRPDNLDGTLYGTPREWVDLLLRLNQEYRQDAFLFWPVGPESFKQIEAFAQEIIPALREQVKQP
ncbi:MAG: LLM class flavin-dependent oxidoreductase [Anaerolineae bacterium]|nr:LLM class flavin-dependent oxidoreductase [Anaerolineae bacterium]